MNKAKNTIQINAMQIPTPSTHYFSQTARLGRDADEKYGRHVAVNHRIAPVAFTRTLVFDNAQKSVMIGEGEFIPTVWMTIIRQMMIAQDLTAETIYNELKELIFPLTARGAAWDKVTAKSLGVAHSAIIKRTSVGPTVSGNIRVAVVNNLGVDDRNRPEYTNLLTDFYASKLARLGFLQQDSGIRVEYTPEVMTVGYRDLLDMMYLHRIYAMLTQLSLADVSLAESVVKHGDKDVVLTGFSVAALSASLSNACHFALSLIDETAAPEDVIATVLTVTNRELDPLCPPVMRLNKRLREQIRIEEFTSNLAIFDAMNEFAVLTPARRGKTAVAEDMIRNHFAEFSEVLAAVPHISTVPAGDVAGRYGLDLTYDHTGRPVRGVFFENWEKDSRVSAFTTVKHNVHRYRYLLGDGAESSAMTDALTAVLAPVSMSRIVNTRMSIHERTPLATRYSMAAQGASLDVAMLSAFVASMEQSLSMSYVRDLAAVIANGCNGLDTYESDLKDGDEDAMLRRAHRLASSFYKSLMHFAINSLNYSTLHIGRVQADAAVGAEASTVVDLPRLALVWEVRTTHVMPLGPTAIDNGVVLTTEPIEAMLYEGEVTANTALSCAYHDIPTMADMARAEVLHAWNWWDISSELPCTDVYRTTIRGRSFAVDITEEDLLCSSRGRLNVRFMLPASARAIIRLWLDWYYADMKAVRADALKHKRAGDVTAQIAADAHRRNLEEAMIDTLRQIASTAMGKNVTQKIVGEITAALYASASLDDRPDILIGSQAAVRDIWVAVAVLKFLAVIDSQDASTLVRELSTSDALAYRIGSIFNDVPKS